MDVRQGKNMTDSVRNNVDQSHFELGAGDAVVFAHYRREVGCLIISYVYAPPALRGTGAAGRLMEGVVAQARASGERRAASGERRAASRLYPCVAMPEIGGTGTAL
jgi:predicted GNAT family acetyltransferase